MNVEAGERVEVLAVDGLTLKVRKVPKLLPEGQGYALPAGEQDSPSPETEAALDAEKGGD